MSEEQEVSIPTFDEYLAEHFPGLGLDIPEDDLPFGNWLEEPDLDFLNDIPESEILEVPESIPEINFEIEALISFTIDELKRLEQALLIDTDDAENVNLAMKIHCLINDYPF